MADQEGNINDEVKKAIDEITDSVEDRIEKVAEDADNSIEEVSETIEDKIIDHSEFGTVAWASHGKRLGAFIVDLLIAMLLASFLGKLGVLLAGAYMLFRDGLNIEFMNKRSLGKKLLKLKVHTTDGSEIDHMTSVRRNWPFALAYVPALLGGLGILGTVGFVLLIVEGIKVVNGNERIGDGMASTYVSESVD